MQTFNHFWALWKHRILSWDLKEAAWHPGEVAGTRDSWEVAVRVGDGGPGEGRERGEMPEEMKSGSKRRMQS